MRADATRSATHIIVSGEEDVEARVSELTGGAGAYAALDCLAGDSVAQMCRCVRQGGKVLIYGAMNGAARRLECGVLSVCQGVGLCHCCGHNYAP
jgi:NADPH:quinone reductase-like Zn-dependent oxidoreductase